MTKDEEATLLKLVVKDHKLVTSLAELVGDIALIMDDLAPKCSSPECQEYATMKNGVSDVGMCSRHAAEQVKLAGGDGEVGHDWYEAPKAESLRRLDEYVKLVKKLLDTKESVQ